MKGLWTSKRTHICSVLRWFYRACSFGRSFIHKLHRSLKTNVKKWRNTEHLIELSVKYLRSLVPFVNPCWVFLSIVWLLFGQPTDTEGHPKVEFSRVLQSLITRWKIGCIIYTVKCDSYLHEIKIFDQWNPVVRSANAPKLPLYTVILNDKIDKIV